MMTIDSEPAGILQRMSPVWRAIDRAGHSPRQEICFGPFRLLPSRRLLLEDDKPVHIGSRALDLLIALVERPGELVSKTELIAKVWPHTFVGECNLKVHIGALRRALADGKAGNRYISTVIGRGYSFVAPVAQSARPLSATALHSPAGPLSNVPTPLIPLIGRDEVVSEVSAQLADHRLIMLVGPGGIGKTTVAVATAEGLTESYEHGVWFVDLTAISDPQLLPAAIRSAVRSDICAEDPSTSLLSFLSHKRILLVLDGCEHIIEAAAEWTLQILRAAPRAQILATSREPLGVEGERLYHLQGLQIPTTFQGLSAADALDFSAIELFVERATSALGEYNLRDADVPLVADICRKLDGIPLAIELAAASIDALGLRALVSRLDDPLRLPATRRRTIAARHRTLRAVLDWSYGLLTEEEKIALRRLSVFAGSFTMEAAAAVAADPTATESEVVDQVVALVAKSLVAVDTDGSDAPLRLLATTRAYALERLAESGEAATIRRRQAGICQHEPRAAIAQARPRSLAACLATRRPRAGRQNRWSVETPKTGRIQKNEGKLKKTL